jgi:ribosomal protein L24
MKPLAKPLFSIGDPVRVTFGKHAGREGTIVRTYDKAPGRPQPTAMVRLVGGGIVVVPVNDLEVVR